MYIYVYIQCVPSQIDASKNCFITFGSSACQSPRTRHKSLKSFINTNKCQMSK